MFQLNEPDQQLLLQVVRQAVGAHFAGSSPIKPQINAGFLTEHHGAFVSIHKGQELRGCIGNITPAGPLYITAAECAIAAAVSDPRFTPMTGDELREVSFEISVLSPMELVQNPNEIQVGVHGLLISKHNTHGLLLPQVAHSYGWDRDRFLTETCRKAGLNPGDWKEGAAIHRFSAFVFGENNFGLSPIP
jgi:AmmeMemoRadiSam system protein A